MGLKYNIHDKIQTYRCSSNEFRCSIDVINFFVFVAFLQFILAAAVILFCSFFVILLAN